MLLEILNVALVLFRLSSVENVPRLRRLPVEPSFFFEYKRYSPDLSLRIMPPEMPPPAQALPAPNPASSPLQGQLAP
jgi:hypothetical protein